MLQGYLVRALSANGLKGLVLLTLAVFSYLPSFGQGGTATTGGDTTDLEGFIQTSQTLSANKVYVIRHNIKINSGATLTIPGNTTLLFDKGTTIVVEGGLNISGSPKNFVEITSLSKANPGAGIIVRGKEGSDINIKYARFSRLTTPISFDLDWYRGNVTIEDNEFKEMNTGESAILLSTPFNKLYNVTDKKTSFSFSNNNFVNNWGSIYIENFQDNVMDLKFDNNLITNNVVYGVDMGVPTNTPVFGYYDNADKRYKAEIKGNSIYGNYQINASTDTIIREVSIGVQGEGEKFNVSNNFFRSSDAVYVSSTFDHFYQNNNLPLLTSEPVATQPSDKVHAHIWKVKLAGSEVTNYAEIPQGLPARDVTFEVYFNRPVTPYGETQLESIFYDTINNGIKIDPITLKGGTMSADRRSYTFSVENADFISNSLGYLVVKNFKDDDGFDSPDFTIGQKRAINNYSKLFNTGAEGTYFSPTQMINNPGGLATDPKDIEALEELSALGDLSYLGAYTSLAKTWELGVQLGTMNYMGDLASKFMDKDGFEWSAGIYGQYNISKWFSARLGFLYGRVSGTDINDPELARRKRLANFRSDIYEGSLTMHFHLLQYGISKGEKFSPSIFAGVSVFHMNPQSRIFTGLDTQTGDPQYLARADDGTFFNATDDEAGRQQFVWVPLRNIGTEGQTSNAVDPEFPSRAAPSQYSLWNIAIPMGINLDFIINKSWVIGVEGGFRFTLTDYMDDVSGFYFDRDRKMQAIVDANPTIEGRVGRETITLPNTVFFEDGGEDANSLPTAALLSNPSLISSVGIDPTTGAQVFNEGTDDAYSFPTARKGDQNRDWYAFFGFKVSKVFGYNKYNKQVEEKNTEVKY